MRLRTKATSAALFLSLLSTSQWSEAKDAQAKSIAASPKASAPEQEPPLDITDAHARANRGTAHTLAPGDWAIRTGLLGMRPDEIYGALGVDYGFKHGLQVGINLLHASAGVFNIEGKWNFWENGPWAMGFEFAPTWIHGDWVWLASGDQIIGNIDVVSLPFGLTASYLPTEWLQFDLSTVYANVEIFGALNSNSLLFNTELSMRQLKVKPTARLHLKKRLSLYLAVDVPLWTQVPGAIEVEIPLAPGVIAGGRSSGNSAPKFGERYHFTLGARSMISRHAFIDFALTYGSTPKQLYGSKVYPKMGLEFRF